MYKAVVIPKAPLCIRDLDPYRHHLKSFDSELPSTLFPEDPKQSLNISWAGRQKNQRQRITRGENTKSTSSKINSGGAAMEHECQINFFLS